MGRSAQIVLYVFGGLGFESGILVKEVIEKLAKREDIRKA